MNPGLRGRMLVTLATAGFVAARAGAADQLYGSAFAKYEGGDYVGAVGDAEAAVRADPVDWRAWQLAGNARYMLGDRPGAVVEYGLALRIHPDNPDLSAFAASLETMPAPAASAARDDPVRAAGSGGSIDGEGRTVSPPSSTVTCESEAERGRRDAVSRLATEHSFAVKPDGGVSTEPLPLLGPSRDLADCYGRGWADGVTDVKHRTFLGCAGIFGGAAVIYALHHIWTSINSRRSWGSSGLNFR